MTAMPRRKLAADRRAGPVAWLLIGSAAMVAGCATGRHGNRAAAHGPNGEPVEAKLPFFERDGPDPHPPEGLALVPDAAPRLEPIRQGGPNKPYEALGLSYVPLLDDRPYTERGLATWYGRKFHGHRTSSGEPYDMYAMTAAHPVLPIPSYARVRNPANGREVIVRINDRGPFHSGRIIDLSYTAALKLGALRGATQVEVQHLTGDDIRTGAWRAPAAPTAVATAGAAQAMVTPATGPALATASAVASPASSAAPSLEAVAVVVASHGPSANEAMSSLPAVAASAPALASQVAGERLATAATVPVASATSTLVPIGLPGETLSTASVAAATMANDTGPSQAEPVVERQSGTVPTWWLQIGAFHQRDAADRLSQDVAFGARWLAPLLAVSADARWFRLRAGPYASVADARGAADRLRRDLQLPAMIVPLP